MAAASKNHYRVLGVNPLSNLEEIHKNYRQLAKKYHPDVCTEKLLAEERMKEISEAYNVLKDNEQRKKYDVGTHFQFRPYKRQKKQEQKKEGFFASLFKPDKKKDAPTSYQKKNPVEFAFSMGITYAQARKKDSIDCAKQEFANLVKLDAGNPDAHYNLGLCHYLLGEYDNAVMCFKKVLSMDPKNVDAKIMANMLIIDSQY